MPLVRLGLACWQVAFAVLSCHATYAQDRIAQSYQRALVAYGRGLDATVGRLSDDAVLKQLNQEAVHPVVILMHGCDGIVRPGTDRPYPAYKQALVDLVRDGYFVLAPDSFAVSRASNCDGRLGAHDVQRLRRKELTYALERILKEPWTDKDRLYVFGQSEGARTVMTYGRYPSTVRAVVGTGWTCWDGEDISLPAPTPYLLIWANGDPSQTANRGCTIGPNGAFFHPEYNKHWVWGHPESHRRIMEMLGL